ncbi:LysR substrate-binding domain-containing protein [Thalassotalea sp. 1_MG-2023]|uniref:LysR substrate-binding domain-containing protein n=1 Tax=Thalassotalea sp. 1_MG-2023 TaxID=3062680 RepID=UPI0026E3C08E|nr:LysR substrate-binding domain-containing protein [Thalassotalea sp. 1_MG-2023]MDO6426189.1 LysR substrate-binding domain-containing protein [Thalassotalea sp. 1_MG-2023]
MLEIKHLKTVHMLSVHGTVRRAANELFMSQSALSHQIKELEHRLGASLFHRNTHPIKFSAQGEAILALALKVLPSVDETIALLKGGRAPHQTLSLAIDCHACFQWLSPVISKIEQENNVQLEIIDSYFGEDDNKADLRFSDQTKFSNKYQVEEIGEFELLVVLPKNHKLANKAALTASDFSHEVLLTYPVPTAELDVFTQVLLPNKITPKQIKQVHHSHSMAQMVAAGLGIAVLPDWLIHSFSWQKQLEVKRITQHPMKKTLSLVYQQQSDLSALVGSVLPLIRQSFKELK